MTPSMPAGSVQRSVTHTQDADTPTREMSHSRHEPGGPARSTARAACSDDRGTALPASRMPRAGSTRSRKNAPSTKKTISAKIAGR